MDEFELRPGHDDEQGGAPDYAVLWNERRWMIELKTESSTRRDQLSSYFTLADHHHPSLTVGLTYLTPPLTFTPPTSLDGSRFAHVTWTQIRPLLEEAWGKGTGMKRHVLIVTELGTLGGIWSQAAGLNNNGVIVGTHACDTAGGTAHPTVWTDPCGVSKLVQPS
ncbi:hypothetical protein ITP53_51295 [Nonomuraea sp. K274]|uniref:Uncharacterized protein n=1 Tax=Nonomuraea cypriaca TaxID=1187855 RepID=A0A931AMY5_9ACTN|nr:hypothetical protein [Nonomuraea cypriaca]MBF8193929.1 hypothetical protein [Nonomuraea cypriaca]